ncbi:MAG TPA: metallophosphoesterase [Chthonomonadaceae bacterium]|nr:metallophosphoesterase [Chthonomonadaceae bacterium]
MVNLKRRVNGGAQVHSPADAPRQIGRRALLKRVAAGLASAAAIDAFGIEPRMLQLVRREVPIAGLHPAFDGYRIALLSDMHYPRWISPELLRHSIRVAKSVQPDLMAFCGDLFDIRGMRRLPSVAGLYDESAARDGVIGVFGNHDYGLPIESVRREVMESTPICLVENTHFMLDRGGGALAIGGVGDLWEGVVNPHVAFEGVPPDVPRIMLSHNPDVAEETSRRVRVDLQLSGHMHGGQLRLPFGPALRLPSRYGSKFSQGLVQGWSHRVYITRGLCTVGWMRFACPPEVTCIVLRSA